MLPPRLRWVVEGARARRWVAAGARSGWAARIRYVAPRFRGGPRTPRRRADGSAAAWGAYSARAPAGRRPAWMGQDWLAAGGACGVSLWAAARRVQAGPLV